MTKQTIFDKIFILKDKKKSKEILDKLNKPVNYEKIISFIEKNDKTN